MMKRNSLTNLEGIIERPIFRAVNRARVPILTIALTYLVFFIIGSVMVHASSKFALDRRDRLVRHGVTHDPAALAYQEGKPFRAFSIEFSRDCLRAVPKVLEGLTIVVPYPLAAYSGWYHGITSVDDNHDSQLIDPFGAIYYLGFQVLTLLAFSLASGAGVNLTVACFRSPPWYQGAKWLRVPKEALYDTLRIYLLVVLVVFLASMWEYLLT